MQFLEYYEGGLRSPLLEFETRDHPVVFRLFPTVHLGDTEYYEALRAHLADCDRVLYEYFETFSSGSPDGPNGLRTLARRLGLTFQLDVFDYQALPATWTRADFSPGQAEHAIAGLPSWWQRAQFTPQGQGALAWLSQWVPLPSRAELALVMDMSQNAQEDWFEDTPLEALVMDERNRVLFNALKKYHAVQVTDGTPFVVGVFYGAAHMPAVSEFLSERLGYVCRRAQWIDPPVFSW